MSFESIDDVERLITSQPLQCFEIARSKQVGCRVAGDEESLLWWIDLELRCAIELRKDGIDPSTGEFFATCPACGR